MILTEEETFNEFFFSLNLQEKNKTNTIHSYILKSESQNIVTV